MMTPAERRICEVYSRMDEDGRPRCGECPLARTHDEEPFHTYSFTATGREDGRGGLIELETDDSGLYDRVSVYISACLGLLGCDVD